MTKSIVVTAKTFVVNSSGKILVLRRSATDGNRPLTWDLPGGAVDYGENPHDSACREIKEEAGLEVPKVELLDVISQVKDQHVITILYKAVAPAGEVSLSFEHDDYKWVSKTEFMNLDIPDKYKKAAQKL